MGGLSSDLLYGMVIGAGIPALPGGSGVVVTVVEYDSNCFVGSWVT